MTAWRECATKKTMHWVVTTWTTGQNNWLSDNTTFAAKFASNLGGLEQFWRGVRRETGKTTFASHRNKNLADPSRNGRTNLVNFVKGTSFNSSRGWGQQEVLSSLAGVVQSYCHFSVNS